MRSFFDNDDDDCLTDDLVSFGDDNGDNKIVYTIFDIVDNGGDSLVGVKWARTYRLSFIEIRRFEIENMLRLG